MVKKGVSLDDKKDRMLKILHDSKEPFTLKALEKLGSKAGVTSMSVKGVLEEMVADNLIELDKIGSTNFYWSFPSKGIAKMEAEISTLTSSIDVSKEKLESLELEKTVLLESRVPTEERQKKLSEYNELQKQVSVFEEKVAEQSKLLEAGNESAVIEDKIKIAKGAANRWTDNTWQLMDYLKKKYGQPKKEIMQMLHMKDDFDYPEYVPSKKKTKRS